MTDPEKFKNLTLDVETYDLAKLWADREIRTVSGHIKWLILKHLPKDLREPPIFSLPIPSTVTPRHVAEVRKKIKATSTSRLTPTKIQKVNGATSYAVGEEGFERARGATKKYKGRGINRGSLIIKLLEVLEIYGEPLTNFELAELVPDQGNHDVFAKRTSQAYFSGILERKSITGTNRRGVYVYRITPRGEKMLKSATLRNPSV
jgi:hypothetical protein